LVLASTSVASAQTESSITWAPCTDAPPDVTAECGTLQLPIDWRKPSGEKFGLAVNRLKATDPARREGVLLINPGGPGGSGVDFAYSAARYFSPDILARFDIIGFDPRGVGRSAPVRCSASKVVSSPSLYPTNQAEFDALVKYNRELRADCRQTSGSMVDHADTGSVIQDVDALRRTLGEKKINYYGISYGTLIGQQYAERYGDKIRAMVIDSNMDHSLDTLPFVATEAATIEDSFNEFAKWCDRTASCPLHGQNVGKVWDALLAKADRGEVHDPEDPELKISADDLIAAASQMFYGPRWSSLAGLITSLNTGKPAGMRQFDEIPVDNPFQAVFCSDYSLPIRNFQDYSVVHAIEVGLAPHMRGGQLGHTASVGCAGWTDKVDNPQHRLRIDDAPEILMLNSVHDPATPHAWAANAHRQTRDTTTLVTYDGWGHGVYTHSACTHAAVDNYLTALTVPKDGTHCAAVEPPVASVRAAAPQRTAMWGTIR
jgi:pimeloyl-ACP methyl ester carboxylesterase